MLEETDTEKLPASVATTLRRVRLLALDVDGVLTDGALGLDSAGQEQKRFHVHDGLGLALMRQEGIVVAWISGRVNPIVEHRARELRVAHVVQGVRDKGRALRALQAEENVTQEETLFIGDDWNDLLAFAQAGIRVAVADAVPEIVAQAHWVTRRPGGFGAVREVCMAILDAQGRREMACEAYVRALQDDDGLESAGQ